MAKVLVTEQGHIRVVFEINPEDYLASGCESTEEFARAGSYDEKVTDAEQTFALAIQKCFAEDPKKPMVSNLNLDILIGILSNFVYTRV